MAPTAGKTRFNAWGQTRDFLGAASWGRYYFRAKALLLLMLLRGVSRAAQKFERVGYQRRRRASESPCGLSRSEVVVTLQVCNDLGFF